MNIVTVKETFRKFAIEHGFADEIVIDNDKYSELSEITGCFQDENGDWVVYDTDERGKPFNVEKHTSQEKAFIKIAKRFGVEEEYISIITHEDKFPDRVVTFDGSSGDCTPKYRSRRIVYDNLNPTDIIDVFYL